MKSAFHAQSNSLVCFVLVLCACLQACGATRGPRDNAFKVRGKIEAVNESENCQLEIHRADTAELMVKKSIGTEFQETIGIAPGSHKIYVVISCSDSAAAYKSPIYEVGKAQQYMHPIDLGMISLRAAGQ